MRFSAKAEGLLGDLARQQGLARLDFDESGLVPIRLGGGPQGGGTEIALGYSPANDALLLFAVVAARPDWSRRPPWPLFERNAELASRRTRLALTPEGALVLVRDEYVAGLDYPALERAMDAFVRDLEAAGDAGAPPDRQGDRQPPRAAAASLFDAAEEARMMIFRP